MFRQKKKVVSKRQRSRTGWMFLIVITVLGLCTGQAFAQTGTVAGTVIDDGSGESLPGATLMLEGTSIGAAADVDGRFTLRNVPAGDHVLIVRFIGYRSTEVPITVEAGERTTQNVRLEGEFIEGDELLIEAHQRGQSRALTRQRQSINIRSIMSSEQIERMTTTTVDGALSRVTGMHGGTNIRGVGSAMSNVTVDGQRMGTTGTASRSVDLSTISVDMVQDLDVIKVITPDMDADALAGVINISMRRPVGAERDLDIRLGGGVTPRYLTHTGPSTRASFSYGDSPNERFAYSVNASYQRSPSASERMNTEWETLNFGEGPEDVLSRLTNELRFDPRDRYGTGIQMTFQPTERTTFHVQGMYNYQDLNESRYSKSYRPRIEHYQSQNRTERDFGHNRGRIRKEAESRISNIHQLTFQTAARHLFDGFDMEYKIGWGYGRYDQDRYRFRFDSPADYEYYVTLEDRSNPTFETWNLEKPEQSLYYLSYYEPDYRWNIQNDNELSATVDFEVPHNYGSMKFGTSTRMTFKDGRQERFRMEYDRRVDAMQFEMLVNQDWHIMGRDHSTYHMTWLLDLDDARDFFYGQYTHMRLDRESWAETAETERYDAYEHTYAGYGMTNIALGRLSILGGVRVEHTRNYYDGREGVIDNEGRFGGATDVANRSNYTFLFPNAQLVFGLGEMTNIRLAYSRSIGRPNFDQLAPYRMINYDRETIRRGNPELDPMVSDNFDLLFEHYFMNVGELTMGFYYKELSDFIYQFEDRIDEGVFLGWRERTYRNGEEATVYGLEASWQQRFDFLPGFLGNFGTFANYTWSRSIADLDRDRDRYGTFPLTGQRPHILNFGLDYDQGGLSVSAFYRWTSPVLQAYRNLEWVPPIQLRERVWFDRYETGRNDLSLSLRYRLTDNIRIWADANNLLGYQSTTYYYDRDFYPSTIRQSVRSFALGVRYRL